MGRSRWTRRRRRPASSPKRRPVPSRVSTWSHQNSGKQAEQPAGLLGGEGAPLGLAEDLVGVDPALGGGAPCGPGWLSIAPSSIGELEDAKRHASGMASR